MAIVYGVVGEELSRRFGGVVRDEAGTVSIGITVGAIVGRDPERVFLLIVNLSPNDLFIAPLIDPSSTRGIRLDPNGGSMTVNIDQDASLPALEWNGIATVAGSNVFFLTVRRDVNTPK